MSAKEHFSRGVKYDAMSSQSSVGNAGILTAGRVGDMSRVSQGSLGDLTRGLTEQAVCCLEYGCDRQSLSNSCDRHSFEGDVACSSAEQADCWADISYELCLMAKVVLSNWIMQNVGLSNASLWPRDIYCQDRKSKLTRLCRVELDTQ